MYVTLLVLLLAVAVVTTNGLDLCEKAANCKCDQDQISSHLYCPTFLLNVRISMHKDRTLSTVKCDIPADLHFQRLPKLQLGRTDSIQFVNCSLPANTSFGSIIHHFGVNTRSLVAHNMGFSTECQYLSATQRNNRNEKTILDENVFRGLQNLRDLDLSDNKIKCLDRLDVFKRLGKLETLKLSNNRLKGLISGIFTNQEELISLYLDNNQLEFLTKETLTGLSSLKNLDLRRNNFKILRGGIFHHLSNLRWIGLGNINTKCKIPHNIFATNNHLNTVFIERLTISSGLNLRTISNLSIEESEFEHFSNNSLTNIIALSESGSLDITNLSLSRNQLTHLPDGLFDGFKQLSALWLSHNNLTIISGQIFQDLHNLQELHLDHNHLLAIHLKAFVNTEGLTLLDLSHNQLHFRDNRSPFMHLVNLETLNLSNNNLTGIPSDLKNMKKLSRLNLASNNISSYRYKDFSYKLPNLKIYYDSEVENNKTDNSLHVFLNNNDQLECDCGMFKFSQPKEKLRYQLLSAITNVCNEPMIRRRCYINLDHLTLVAVDHSPFKCPEKCECFINLTNKWNVTISVHCESRGLTTVPEIPSIANPTSTLELYIHNNSLTELPQLQNNLHVTIIQAFNNSIYEIKEENLPPNLRALDVSYNKITTISPNVYEILRNHKKLEIVSLAGNPWMCDCTEATKALIEFVEKNISLTDLQDARCQVSSGSYELSSGNVAHLDDLCFQAIVTQASIVLAVLAFLFGIVGILFYKYQQLLKVWLYAHHICLWFIDEEELDKDKKYDAFISYSHHDEDFAFRVVNELEHNSPNYKLCVHERDFVPGELIAVSIVKAMNNSRRTVVILSKNFLESVWGLHEFHCAYMKGLTEKRVRLIIIIYGDIGDIDKLDPAIKSYLTTRTYIKWGDPWFWEKLRYALPHRN